MYVVLGSTSHVGSAVAGALLEHDLAVTVVTRDADHATTFKARAYARMTEVTRRRELELPDDPERGTTDLQTYIDALVASRRRTITSPADGLGSPAAGAGR